MEAITPPIDIFKMDELSPDLQRKIALDLSYEEIINLCKSKKSLANICRNPYFWKDKLEKDFPEINTTKLKVEEFRAKYELRIAHRLSNELKKLEEELENEDETEEERERNYKEHIQRENRLKKEISNLRNKAYAILPIIEEIKYFRIDLPFQEIVNLEQYKHVTDIYPISIKNRKKAIIKIIMEYLGPNYVPKTGHLIALFSNTYSKIPYWLVYIYDNDGILGYDITYIGKVNEISYLSIPYELESITGYLLFKYKSTNLSEIYKLDFPVIEDLLLVDEEL